MNGSVRTRTAVTVTACLAVFFSAALAGVAVAQRQASEGEPQEFVGFQAFDRTALPADVLFESVEGGFIQGVRCGTRPVGELEAMLIEADLDAWRRERAAAGDLPSPAQRLSIPVAFHVVTQGSRGDVSNSQLEQQIAVLNGAFGGAGFSFFLDSVDRTDNGGWFSGCAGSAERPMKEALAIDPARTMNIYTCEPDDGILGYAYLPGDLPSGHALDGVVLLHSSLPGGSAAPYNRGDTGTHEVGHYLGLLHTFEGGCSDGDRVADTPAEGSPAYGCPTGRDTCPGGGDDPIRNFMDYTDDACMDRFSSGQANRMADMTGRYRPGLGSGSPGGGGGGDGGGDGGDGGDSGDGGNVGDGAPEEPVDLRPLPPEQRTPSGVGRDRTPRFRWLPVADAKRYRLQVFREDGRKVIDTEYFLRMCDEVLCGANPGRRLKPARYGWRIQSGNEHGWGEWSPYRGFKVRER